MVRNFLCCSCGKSIYEQPGSVLYIVLSDKDRIVLAIKLFSRGISIKSIAEVQGVKLFTVR